jgi:hypothetical protein
VAVFFAAMSLKAPQTADPPVEPVTFDRWFLKEA